MTNREKLEGVKTFLRKNRIATAQLHKKLTMPPDLFIPEYHIVVKLSEGKKKDDEFFHAVKHQFRPLFIRDEETPEFVLEKMQNLIIDIMKRKQALYEKKNKNAKKP